MDVEVVRRAGIEPATHGLLTTSIFIDLSVCGLDYPITLAFIVRVQPL